MVVDSSAIGAMGRARVRGARAKKDLGVSLDADAEASVIHARSVRSRFRAQRGWCPFFTQTGMPKILITSSSSSCWGGNGGGGGGSA